MFEKLAKQKLQETPQEYLKTFERTKDFLVAIDTDGCIADNMNAKQILIFHPLYMEFYQLWEIESYFREIAEFYNLFSVHRGCNRFLAIRYTLNALHSRQDVRNEVKKLNVTLPEIKPVEQYIEFCRKNNYGMGNVSLDQFLSTRVFDSGLYKLSGWSQAVNKALEYIVDKVQPFENVRECLEIIYKHADIAVISQTPYEDLFNYWNTHGLLKYVKVICGQEMGSKTYHIEMLKKVGKYSDEAVLMVGDAIGDFEAVKKNNGLFYPVVPGNENDSWKKFPEVFELFLTGKYHGELEQYLIGEFSKKLPDRPPWQTQGYDHTASYRKNQEIRKSLYKQFNPDGRLLIL
ncbi:MAG TPA: HAD hydrolase-like protein [bacterium]|nr:HAD hydrolase-like protein [bacterium]HOL34784.1 HAD hydrolase-like protein [bacterium]HPP07757.1 HAD hydrolase-like protein [bacterium]